MTGCTLCPRACGANRKAGAHGYCGADNTLRIARAAPHFWEEPCISGTRGAGAVFFCHCSLHCVYCQNAAISTASPGGQTLTAEQLSQVFLALQAQKVHNIELVTPTHYAPQILKALAHAKQQGLTLPVVYNTSGYESVQTLQKFDGLIDIYLPDLKYYSSYYAAQYSAAPDYFETACQALQEMVRQTGKPVFDAQGILTRGVIVRHLMLPELAGDTAQVLRYLAEHHAEHVLVSLMRQYTPTAAIAQTYPELNRVITDSEYAAALALLQDFGLTGFSQEAGSVGEGFIPAFCSGE